MLNLKKLFTISVTLTLLLLSGIAKAQIVVAISNVTAETGAHFADKDDFSAGTLTVTFIMNTGYTTANVAIDLASGIEYIPNSVTVSGGGATVAQATGHTAAAPRFTVTAASGSNVALAIKRKVTKAALGSLDNLKDTAVLTIGGVTSDPVFNNPPYDLKRPTLTVQLPETIHNDALGTHTKTFTIRNTGYGIVKDVYFSVNYPADVVGNSFWYAGTKLTPMVIGGKTVYKVPNVHLANNQAVTISENYTVKKCTAGRQIGYEAHWGTDTVIFETNTSAKNISVSTGIPIITHSSNSAFNYFKWQDGFCGNILGTYYVRFDNETADAKGTAYNVEVQLFDGDPTIGFSYFEPINIRLVATDGTEIPIAATGTGNTRFIKFSDLAAVSNASLGSRNVGFTDEDGDGFKDDLKKGAYFQIAFDLKKKQEFQCLQPGKGQKNYFSLQPRAYVLYDNVCTGGRDTSELRLIDYGTMRIYFNGVNDASKLPAQLVQNVPSAGYIAPGMNWPSLGIHQRLKNEGTLSDNMRQFKYVITTPAGLKLQNVKLYRRTNVFGASEVLPVNIADIAPNTTVTITTSNTAAYRDLTSGYLSFDALLQNCNGRSEVPITYSVYLMVKNGDGTYCDIPLVCGQTTNIPAVCAAPCTIQAPTILSTIVERADNSYGWKDYTMAARRTRSEISPIERMRALYLDDIEFITKGQQHAGKSIDNLFYYVKVEKTAELEPKKITLTINGGVEQTFNASATNPVKGANAAGKKFFRWDLTSLLPAGTLPAGATFTAVATYQVKNNNPTNSNDRTMDIQSGIESFFYTLDNPATDTAINAEGYHIAEKHCGPSLTPIFYIAETQSMLATNEYKEFSGCNSVQLGSNLIYAARRFKPGGTYFSQEFRPARLTKKITIKMPSAYQITNIKYTYSYKIAEAAKEATLDMSKLTVVDDGTWKTYTYINPPKGTTGHLPPGMITVVNDYNEYIKVFIQPSCKAKTVDGNKSFWNQGLDAKAMNEIISSNIEYEDYYYHYAETANSLIATDYLNERPILFAESKKPDINIEAVSQLTVKATKNTEDAIIKIENIKDNDAPFGWVSIPDVTGLEVLSLTEITSAKAHVRTYTAQSSISGEKMFFLSEAGNDGKILKNSVRYFKINYKITNCNSPVLHLKVYAGWNCSSNPTTGYRNTCSDKSATFSITIAKSKKEIAADPSNPGYNDPNKVGSITMCDKTPYTYTINSADEGDIYDAKLVVTQASGITFHEVEVEYPLGSGTKYQVGTGANKIHHSVNGNKHTFDISAILPNGSLPGSLSEPVNANNRQFKLTFKVQPDCNFSAGSSFDIDIEGNNLCGSPASGDKTRAIIAGITGVNVNKYSINLDPLTYVSGNGSLCGGGITYKTRVTIVSADPTFQVGNNARLKFTIPEGYELAPSFALYGARTPYGTGALWANSARKQSEERTLASGSELVMDIPAGMKNGQFFEFGIKIIQKANAVIACDTPKNLKVFATDTVTGVTCATLTPPATTCPSLTVGTSLERTIQVKNERPELSFKDISTTSEIQGGKEKLTIKYKVANAATASATISTRPVVASLYYDANNNGLVDSGDTKLTTYTSTETLGKGVTSPERTFDYQVEQDKICRLLLVLKNEDNVCLCGDVVTKVTAPTKLSGLVSSLTTCATSSVTFEYNSQAPSYVGYEWKAVSPSNALGFLNNTNTPTPTFTYNGATLTNTLTVTYTLVVKRTNGCETQQTVTVLVNAVPKPTLTVSPTLVIDCKAANVDASIGNWLQQAATATAGAACATIATLTHNYEDVKPTDLCEAAVLTITFTAIDNFGSVVTKTTTITLVNIKANNETITFSHGAVASSTIYSVLDNDKVGTQTATAATVSMTVVTPATGVAGSATPTLNSDGTITVPAGTKSGTYTIGYKICAKVASVTACDTATATIVVGAQPITATPDVMTVTVGDTSSSSVIDNDHIGTATTTTSTVSVTVVTPAAPKSSGAATPTITSEGKVMVPNNTPAGVYTIVYEICEKLNTGNCTTTTATVVVPVAPIVATSDVVTVTAGSTSSGSVIDNDHIGTATTTTSTVSVTVVTPATPKGSGVATPTITDEGKVMVPNNTPAGVYTLVYEICEKLNTGNCTTTTATLVVPLTPITATPDVMTVTVGDTSSSSVIDNDHIGTATTTTSTVSVSVVTPAAPKSSGAATPTITSEGKVTVPNNTPAGVYTIVYEICEKLNTGNCTTTTATVVVPLTPITATPDVMTVTVGDTSSSSVIDNDHIGTATTTTSTVSVSVVTPAAPKSSGAATPTLTSEGKVMVPNNTPAGVYTIVYEICEKLNAGNCTTTTATVVVPVEPILATPDVVTVTAGSTSSGSVIDNDHIGTATTTTSTVSVTVVTPATPKGSGVATPTITDEGKVMVPNNTPAGVYTIVYEICEKLNTGNCTTTTATVVVPLTPITATPDVVTVTAGGTSSGSVIDNDHIGTATTTTSTVSVTVVTPAAPKSAGAVTPTITSEGKVMVPNNTPAGVYTIVYEICEKLNTGNCTTTTATVVVPLTPITATPDVMTVTVGDTSSSSVIDNDHIGTATTTTSTVSVSVVTPAAPKSSGAATPTITSEGKVTVPNNTPAGVYTIVYEICEKLNTGNCTTTTATVVVPLTPITATPDVMTVTVGDTSSSSVIDNDHIGTATTTTSTVSVSVVTPAAPKSAGAVTPTITSEGKVMVPNNTPAGVYTIVYEICEKLNTGNCTTTTATVVVPVAPIVATSDVVTVTAGSTSSGSVIDNDHIGTATTTTSTVSVTVVTPAAPKSAGAATPTITSEGKVMVPNNTPAGVYTIVYEICEKLNTGNCTTTTATVVVPLTPITATPDVMTVTVGDTSSSSVIDNDHIGTATTTTSTVSVSVVTPATPKGSGVATPMITSEGKVMVPNNTPAGVYTIVYEICEKLNAGNCTTTTATVVVPVEPILATPDVVTVTAGSTSSGSVIDNDHIGTATTTTSTVSVTVVTPATPKGSGVATPTITNEGKVTVPNNTPAGTYTIVYRVCEKLNVGNCTTTTATVVVPLTPIRATPDVMTVTVGDTSSSSVIDNDHIGTATTTTSTVSVTVVTPAAPKSSGAATPTITSEGKVMVPNNTPAGVYTLVYEICEKLNTGNCTTTTATVVVPLTPITATPDVMTVTAGSTSSGSVIDNDHIGTATTTTSTVSVTVVTPAAPKSAGAATPTITSEGKVIVPNNTPAGVYTIVYEICEKLNTGNCTTTTATVVVPLTPITATPDVMTVTVGDTSSSSVIDNDHIGTATTTTSTVSVTVVTPATPKGSGVATPTITDEGKVTVPNNTPAGTYTIVYRVCEKLNAGNCTTTTATVVVPVEPIVATPDVVTVTAGGTSSGSVIDNDHIGTATTTTSTVSVTVVTPATPKGSGVATPTITDEGKVTVPNNTPAGTYTIVYRVCEKLNAGNCTTTTATVVVPLTPITATPDVMTVTVGDTSSSSVIDNDHIGTATTTTSTVSVSVVTPATPKGSGVATPMITSEGKVMVPNNTPAGVYTIVYEICEKLNAGNCTTTTATINVVGSVTTPTATPTITATPDVMTVTVGDTSSSSVIDNDHIGTATTTTSTVSVSVVTPAAPKSVGAVTPTLTSEGKVTVPNNTPAGTYTIVYRVCEKLNAGNCTTTTATINVVGSVTTPTATPTIVTIEANADEFNHYEVATQTTLVGNVLSNDKLNGTLSPSVRSVTITTPAVSNPRAPYIHPATGDVTVPPHTPAGVYELPYTICALASPTECSTATAVVRISTIEAHNDGQHQLGTTAGGIISSVLTNDKLNGQRPAAGEVNINWIPSSLSGFTFNNDGTIDVAAGTPVGTYTIGYTLCATATPTLCSERAEVVVAVTAAVPVPPFSIMAVYDGPHYIDQGTATTVASVLANDTLDADPATTGNVSLTWNISSPVGISLNADGTVAVANTTAAGVYKVPYTICAKNGTLCATTDIEIVVIAPTVTPTIEVNGETFTYTGSPVVGNVLTNEKLNGVPNPSVRSVTISIMPPLPGVNEPYLNPETGDVIVPPATVPGAYTVTYRVCTTAAPVSCDTASVRVVVPASASTPTAAPVAADDRATTIRNTPVTIAVLSNDTPNGATLPNITTTPLNGTAIVNADGSIEYRPSTNFVGTDRIVYELCDAFGQCASAVVTIEVTNGLLPYNGISIDGNERNSYFHIGGIEAYPKNVVKIFNRWGVQVFEIEHYDNVRNVFRGLSNGRVTIERGSKLPQGTYYYIIEYEDDNHQQQKETGWLYLKRN